MLERANVLPAVGAALAFQVLLAAAAPAQEGAAGSERPGQAGEDRWVPSLAIVGGLHLQQHAGAANSVLFVDPNPDPVPLRGFVEGDDLAVSPFVGAALQLMTPALPIPTRPRFFLGAEILPTFASDRSVALEGDPECVRRGTPLADCLRDETFPPVPDVPFPENAILGDGTRTIARVGTLLFGASLGLAFPFQVAERQLRIRPSVGWIRYKVEAEGLVVHGQCLGTNPNAASCSREYRPAANPPSFLRETVLSGSSSGWFDGIGPGLELEMDAGRFDFLGVSLFLGGGAYYTLGDRTISFGASQAFPPDPLFDVPTVAEASFRVEVEPWVYRVNAGVRLHWLGSAR